MACLARTVIRASLQRPICTSERAPNWRIKINTHCNCVVQGDGCQVGAEYPSKLLTYQGRYLISFSIGAYFMSQNGGDTTKTCQMDFDAAIDIKMNQESSSLWSLMGSMSSVLRLCILSHTERQAVDLSRMPLLRSFEKL